MCTVIHSVKKLRVEPMTAKAGSRGHVRWAGRMTCCVMTHDLAMPAECTVDLLHYFYSILAGAGRGARRLAIVFFFFFLRGFRNPRNLCEIRPCAVEWIFVNKSPSLLSFTMDDYLNVAGLSLPVATNSSPSFSTASAIWVFPLPRTSARPKPSSPFPWRRTRHCPIRGPAAR